MNLLIEFFANVKYSREGTGKMLVDIAFYRKLINQIDIHEVDQKFKNLQFLTEVYVLKNDEREINQHFKEKRELEPSFKN